MHSVLLFLLFFIPPYFYCIDCNQHLFSLSLLLACWPNQSSNIWCGTHILLLWAFGILDAICLLYNTFIVCRVIVFTVIWIIQVTIPVQPIFGVQNAFTCTNLITSDWMTVASSDAAGIQYLSLSPREIVCTQSGWHRKSFWQFEYSHTIMLKEWPGCFEDLFRVQMYSMSVICLFWVRDSFCAVHRFWLPCHISKILWILAILCNVLSSTSFFISKLYSVFVVSDTGISCANIPLFSQPNYLTTTFLNRVLPVSFYCLQPITSRPREKLVSTPTPCGMIGNMSCATLERSGYYECVSSWWRHQSAISGIQSLLLISIRLEW